MTTSVPSAGPKRKKVLRKIEVVGRVGYEGLDLDAKVLGSPRDRSTTASVMPAIQPWRAAVLTLASTASASAGEGSGPPCS